ncbi:MAG: oxidoreductase domain protein [Paenibacillus sp.]|nr:oxidoreductase domain protein [Paenibacillus sp.]
MIQKQLRIGMIGTGGNGNAKHMPSLSKIDEVALTAFCDLSEERAREAASKFGHADCQVYTDYRKLLDNPAIDVVHISTPNHMHAEIAIAALEAGKHVMCEKPMATRAADARKMAETARRTGKKLSIGYQWRLRPENQYLKQLCQSGEFGRLYYAKSSWLRRRGVPTWGAFLDKEKQGGGPLIDLGSHALDLVLWLLDNYKPASVTGSSFHVLGGKENAVNEWGAWEPAKFTVEDSAFGFIKMTDGTTIVLEASWALNTLQTGGPKVQLCGSEGGADMEDGLRINGERAGRLFEQKIDLKTGSAAGNPAEQEARQWIDCILNGTDPLVTAEQALVVTEILEAIYASSATGKTVYWE